MSHIWSLTFKNNWPGKRLIIFASLMVFPNGCKWYMIWTKWTKIVKSMWNCYKYSKCTLLAAFYCCCCRHLLVTLVMWHHHDMRQIMQKAVPRPHWQFSSNFRVLWSSLFFYKLWCNHVIYLLHTGCPKKPNLIWYTLL